MVLTQFYGTFLGCSIGIRICGIILATELHYILQYYGMPTLWRIDVSLIFILDY